MEFKEFSTGSAKKLIDNHDVISFDIFDTLLLRPYVKPTDLFFHLEKLENIKGYAQERINAESRARRKYTDTEEITYDEIYLEIDGKYKSLKEKELELELLTLCQNPEIYELYKYAKEKNKKIIITSDMYLPKDFIKTALEKNGYDDYCALFLSSEEKCTKCSCNLYKHIIKDLKILPEKILHIGDNKESDCKKAKKTGISALFYPQVISRFFVKNPRAKLLYEENDCSSSILIGVLAINYIRNSLSPQKLDFWRNIGYEYGGVACFGYMKWLEEQVKKDNKNCIMFIARDGYSLKKVFDSFGNKDIKTHYIYAPRFLSLICTLGHNNDTQKMQIIFNYYKDKSEIFKKINLTTSNITEELKKIFEEHIDEFNRLAKIEIDNYKHYFEAQGISKNNTCMVETCSINFSSQKLLVKAFDDDVTGYYWQMAKKTEFINKAFFEHDIRIKGYSRDWNFMEWLMTSPEYPIETVINGKAVYKYNISKHEETRSKTYPALSKGIEDFAMDIIKIFKEKEVYFNVQLIEKWMIIFADNSTRNEEKMFAKILHSADIDHHDYIHLFPWWYDKKYKIISSYIYGFIPFIKIKEWRNNIKYYLFNIPAIRIYTKFNTIKYYLFGWLRIYKTERGVNV